MAAVATGEGVQALLIEDLVADRIAELHRQGDRARARQVVRRSSRGRLAAARLLEKLGFWLVTVGLRLALAGDSRVGASGVSGRPFGTS
jgi:hypothetical protein